MCDPMMALAVGTTLMSAVGTYQQGMAQSKAASYQAAATRQQAAYEEDRVRDRARRLLAQGRVAAAKSGTTLSGSSLDTLADSAAEAELDALAVRYGGTARAQALDYEAKTARRAGIIGAGTQLLMAPLAASGYAPAGGVGGGGRAPYGATGSGRMIVGSNGMMGGGV